MYHSFNDGLCMPVVLCVMAFSRILELEAGVENCAHPSITLRKRSDQCKVEQRTLAYDICIRDVELLVPLVKAVNAGPDCGCKRPVSLILGHLLPARLHPFECVQRPGDSRIGFAREIIL